MLEKIIKYYSIVLIIFSVFIMINMIAGRIRFGHGIGDVFYYMISWVAISIFLIVLFLSRKNTIAVAFINIFFTGILIILILEATFLRGVESPWNGHILF